MARTGFDRGPGGTGEGTIDAANYASISQAAMELARAWAQAAVDTEPDPVGYPSRFSSYHYSVAAGDSAAAALASQVAAAASATAAGTSETNAAASAATASAAATTATSQAGAAAASASGAATSESNALTYSNNASASATSASSSASSAATSASNAATSASSAGTSAASALASLQSFQATYVGASASDPTLDGNGNALTAGDMYYNTVANEMRVYSGSAWLATYLPAGAYVLKTGDTITGSAGAIALKIIQGASAGTSLSLTDATQSYTMNFLPGSTANYLVSVGSRFSIYGSGADRFTVKHDRNHAGVGIVPNAGWSSSRYVFQFGDTAALWGDTVSGVFSNNMYFDGTNTRALTTAPISDYYQYNGQHVFRATTGSVTAGNAGTLSNLATMDHSTGVELNTRLSFNNALGSGYVTAYMTKGVTDSNFRLAFYNGTSNATGGDQGSIRFDYVGVTNCASIKFYRGASSDSYGIGVEVNGAERLRFGPPGTWTTSGWGRGVLLGQSYVLQWAKGGSSYSWGLGQSGDGLYLARSTAEDSSAAVTYVMQVTNAAADAVFVANVTAYSDRRLKTDIVDNYIPLEDLLKVRPVSFRHVDRLYRKEVGAIAQEVQEVIPEAVVEDEKGVLSLDYGRAALVMVASLAKEVAALKSEIERLKA